MNRLCIIRALGGSLKPRRHEQRLLRNMGVLKVVLDLLRIPFDTKEDIRALNLYEKVATFNTIFLATLASRQKSRPGCPHFSFEFPPISNIF